MLISLLGAFRNFVKSA